VEQIIIYISFLYEREQPKQQQQNNLIN